VSVHAPSRPAFAAPTRVAESPRVLVLYAHPQPHRSRVNQALAGAIRELDGVTFHDLYEAWPDGAIDVPFEQELLARHSTIVMQHPFYWYSVPPLLKEWIDVVLTWGWAYGRGGTALLGKRVMTAITAGGLEAGYQRDGYNRFTVRELLAPVDQTAFLCGMAYLPPFVVYGTHRLEEPGVAQATADYRAVIEALRDGRTPPADLPRCNADLAWVLRPVEGK
jgi:glutathione-regulated potassium-efflux system ancillary protein KefG